MKTIKQTMKALALGAVVVCGFAALAEEETPPQTAWTYSGGVLTSDDGWKFSITDAGDGGVVLASRSAIGTDMCVNLRTAEDVIGKPITTLGKYVFSNSSNSGTGIQKVWLPLGLKRINEGALWKCQKLTNVYPFLPETVEFIGAWAFTEDVLLAGDLVLSNPNLDMGQHAGGKDREIGNGAFATCNAISSADLSQTRLKYIGDFYWCTGLKSVKLPETLETLGFRAFGWCSALTNVTPLLPASMKVVGQEALRDCPIQGDLVLPKGATMSLGGTYKDPEFAGAHMTSADFSKSALTEIPMAFYDNYYLQRVIYPPTATKFHANYTHWSNTQLRDIRFMSWITNFDAGDMKGTFGSTPNDGRIVYPKGNADWEAYVQKLKDANNFTPWDPESDAAKAYLTRFADTPWKPIGSAVIHKGGPYGDSRKWLVPHNYASGMMVLVR